MTRRLGPLDIALALALATFVLAAGWWRLVPGVVGVYHDDAIYAVTAIGLAEGKGYRLHNLPGAPPQTKYPVGYPALLALSVAGSADRADILARMQWATLTAAAGFVALFYLYAFRFGYAGRSTAALIALVVASTPLFLHTATIPLSEAPFALVLVASFWALERAGAVHRPASRQILAGIFIGLPALFRSIGLVTTVGAAICLLCTRRLRWPVAAGMATTTLPWLAFAWVGAEAWGADPVASYYVDYLGSWQQVAPDRLPWILGINTFSTASAILGMPAAGLSTAVLDVIPLSLVPACVALAVFIIPGAVSARRRAIVLPLAGYAAAMLVWPWPPQRFVLPILAFALLLWKDGVRSTAAALGLARPARLLLPAGAIVLIGFNLALQRQVVALNRATGYPHQSTTFLAPAWREYEAVFEWIRDNTPPDAVVASGLDTMVNLYTGRPALRPFQHRPDVLFYGRLGHATGTPDEFARFLARNRVRYLVAVPMPGFDEAGAFGALIERTLFDMPSLLTARYRGESGFVVYEVAGAR